MQMFNEILYELLNQFTDPKKRIFLGYILLSVLIAFFWLIFKKRLSIKLAKKKIFDKRIFLSRSAKSDYIVFVINQFIMFLISPLIITQLAIATLLFYFFHSIPWLSSGMFNHTPVYIIVSLFTLTLFILDDFTKYFVHRCMHKFSILWAFHKVHHSATTLTPITVFRTHPLEGIIFSLRSAITQALLISIFVFLFGKNVDLFTILGVNIFIFFFNVAGSNLRHSHIGIRYWWWLEYILISPAQHQLHHSVSIKHHDKNFGAVLAIWDWLFSSHHHSEEFDKLTLGLNENDEKHTHKILNLYLNPIKEVFGIISYQLLLFLKLLKSNSKKLKQSYLKGL